VEILILDKVIDLSHEAVDGPRSVDKKRTWLASDLTEGDWSISLDQIAYDEIYTMIKYMHANPAPIYLRHPDQFNIPHLRQAYFKCKTILKEGIGFPVIDKLPIDAYETDDTVTVYWILGQLI
jgi:hypothetical protein